MRNSPLPRMSRRGRVTIGVLVGVFVLFTLLGWGVDAWTDWLWFDEVGYTEVFTGVLLTRLLLFLAVGLGDGGWSSAATSTWRTGCGRCCGRTRPSSHAWSATGWSLAPRLGTWIALIAAVIGLFAGLVRAGPLAAVDAVPQRRPLRRQGPAVRRRHRLLRLRATRSGGTCSASASPRWCWPCIGALAVHYLFGGVRLQGVGDRMTHRGARPPDHAGRGLRAAQGRRVLAGPAGAAAGAQRRRQACTAPATPTSTRCCRRRRSSPTSRSWWRSRSSSSPTPVMRNLVWPGVSLALLGISAVAIGGIYPLGGADLHGQAERRGQGSAVHPAQHRRDPGGVRAGRHRDDAVRGEQPHPAGEPGHRHHDRAERPAARPGSWSPRRTPSFSRCAASTTSARSWTSTATTSNGKAPGLRGRRPRDQLRRADRPADTTGINRHTVYTHGYGLWPRRPTRWSAAAQPYFVSGFLGEQTSSDRACCLARPSRSRSTQPRIYYGEQIDRRLRDRRPGRREQERRVRPAGRRRPASSTTPTTARAASRSARSSAGCSTRIKYAESNFLLSDAVNDNSKLLYVRDPRDRVEKVAPFLTLDGDPYPAVVDGRIMWILDGYTTSATYPYSQRVDLQTATTRRARPDRGTFALAAAEHQLHAQLGEGHRRRVRRHGHAVRVRRAPTRSSRRGTRRSAAT